MPASSPYQSNTFEKKRSTHKILKLSYSKSLIFPFITYHSHFRLLSDAEELYWSVDHYMHSFSPSNEKKQIDKSKP